MQAYYQRSSPRASRCAPAQLVMKHSTKGRDFNGLGGSQNEQWKAWIRRARAGYPDLGWLSGVGMRRHQWGMRRMVKGTTRLHYTCSMLTPSSLCLHNCAAFRGVYMGNSVLVCPGFGRFPVGYLSMGACICQCRSCCQSKPPKLANNGMFQRKSFTGISPHTCCQ